MKAIKNIALVLLVTVFAFSCKNEAKPEVISVQTTTKATTKVAELDPNATYAKAEFKIEGMTCAMGCAKTIEKKMAKMEGVKSAIVDFDRELAMVEYDEAKVTPTSLEATVIAVAETYAVKDMHTVDAFSTAKKECTLKCKEDCTVKDCADCAAKTVACKIECDSKAKASDSANASSVGKMACAEDCEMACCADAKKA